MSHEVGAVQFHIDPHTRDKSITGNTFNDPNTSITIKEKDVLYFGVKHGTHITHPGGRRAVTSQDTKVVFTFEKEHTNFINCSEADAIKIKGFFIGKEVEVDANGLVVAPHTDDEHEDGEAGTTTEHSHETPELSEDVTQIKKDLNVLGLSVANIYGRLAEIAPTVYGSFRLEVVAATDNSPKHADLFGLDVVDANPANEATDTIVCSINMEGADMCQHKMNPEDPEDNQWVIEVLSSNGLRHRFHTHSAGDFGLIFDAVRAGVTTKVYSTRPAPAQQPSPTG
ncbi:MAG: hypothetical protein K0U41_08035 [Gammaproteobacteria bacterium]|nr:hypothetical protein [Gammaproteobacteria bacterium]